MSKKALTPQSEESLQLSEEAVAVRMKKDMSTGSDQSGIPFSPLSKSDSLVLYEGDLTSKANKLSNFLNRYSSLADPVIDAKDSDKVKKKVQMGTIFGVFLPSVQNIFGVLFFIRLAWITGTAGVLESFFITLICCAVTFATTISLSAIATNGMVPAGGPYYMISRNLGPELGGAVGILFYLASTIAASMYLLGSVEIFLLYCLPEAKPFTDIYNCFRVFGTALLAIVSCIVLGGVRLVNKMALPTVLLVNVCILMTIIGVFFNFNGSDRLKFCMVGDRLPNLQRYIDAHPGEYLACNGSALVALFCRNVTSLSSCDPYFMNAWSRGEIGESQAISGLTSRAIKNNLYSKYLREGDILARSATGNEPAALDAFMYVTADMTTSFIILIGVFFPSVTGIMQGSNRSGDLKDASHSIPIGTLSAQIITSIIYMSGAVFFGASVNEMFIRDKFGQSAYGKLVVAELAVPHPMVIIVGSMLASAGAGMQCLTGAPRLLRAIAHDGVIPVLEPFKASNKSGEPWLATLLSIALCEFGILIAQLESITALISQFFLMCYLSVNAACFLQGFLKAPNWRPRFRFYHWLFSLFGALLCVAVMFISHWGFALLAVVIGVIAFKYIEYRGAEKEWGDGMRGLSLSAAMYSLLKLEHGSMHTKNWRPQLLVLCSTQNTYSEIKDEYNLLFASHLKAGKGLTVIATVLTGKFCAMSAEVQTATRTLISARKRLKVSGFYQVLVSEDLNSGISALIQTSGLGLLKHNTVVIGWPSKWRQKQDRSDCRLFVETVRVSLAASCAVVVTKNCNSFPDSKSKIKGNVDLWWIVNEGGMLVILPFLLRQHRVWRASGLRVFTVASKQDNSVQIKKDLEKYLYQLRIDAEVDVVETAHDQPTNLPEIPRDFCQRFTAVQDVSLDNGESQESLIRSKQPKMNLRKFSAPVQTFLSTSSPGMVAEHRGSVKSSKIDGIGFDSYNLRCMETAIKLNTAVRSRSSLSELVFITLPEPKQGVSDEYYMEFIEALTEGLGRVILVKGTDKEVVTIYS